MSDAADLAILNDRWHTAVHEAGHAVIGRALGMICGHVTILADDDSVGHAITADPWAILHQWHMRGRLRRARICFRGRILTLMAGAEAEVALLGFCEGGDSDDRWQVAMMLESGGTSPGEDLNRMEARLRRAARALCRRHAPKIEKLAQALLEKSRIEDDAEIREIIGIPAPPDVDCFGLNALVDEGAPIRSISRR